MNVLGENCCSDMLYSVVHSSAPLCSKGPVVRKTVSAGVNVMMFDSSCIKWYGRLLSRGFYQSASLNEENMNEIVGLRAELLNFTSTLY